MGALHRLLKPNIQVSLYQINHISACSAGKALKAIILKVQARMSVLMEWAERLMAPYPYPHFLSHLLYRRSPYII